MKGTKRVVISIMVLCLVLVGLPTPEKVYAASDSDFVIENGVLTKYQGSGGDVVVPDGVTSIGDGAFQYRSELTGITIPSSVTAIGDAAFINCSNLTSVTMPDSVTVIDHIAFSGCSSLTSIKIPNSATKIGGGAFSSCWRLTRITIPDSVTEIGSGAFSGCRKLKEFTIPKNVTKLGSSILGWCDSLEKITILNKKVNLIKTHPEYKGALSTLIGETEFGDSPLSITKPTKNLTIYGYKYSTADEFAVRMNTLKVTGKGFGIKSIKFVVIDKDNTTLDKIKVPKSITITKGKSKKLSIQLPSNLKRVTKFTKKQGQVKISIAYSKETSREDRNFLFLSYSTKKIFNDTIKATEKGTGYAYTTVTHPNGDKKVFATKVIVK